MSNTNQDTSPAKNDFLEQDQDGVKECDSQPLGNPTPPPDVDMDKLRGDRIGDTVYSGKWCIQTVMKLMQSNVIKNGATEINEEKTDIVDMEEELQNEVGALWDMTINVDVCLYLHSVGAIESICYTITNSRCPRATEMCVGMLANIITHSELWKLLCGESAIFNILIQLLTNTDQPVLLEVARFFNTALCHTDHVQCYACFCENSPMVTQELMRILSGSTNVDLLKQTAELTYTLMSLDEKDTCFCSLFADVDFVSSVVEASRELGYEHETSGQNYVMEVFHYFTTYEAGVLAIENILEQIAEANTLYLKILCHSLILSNNTEIITTIIATLDHIFCRHLMVRIGLMSSPSFIHAVLKTLVAVYRKLGFYKSIAYPKRRSSGHSSRTSSTWKMEEDSQSHVKAKDTSSWSERANLATSTSTVFRTPDASPSQAQQNKELEVSWSERRMSSPLVDDFEEQKWKRPKKNKRLKRKESVKDNEKDVKMSDSEREAHKGFDSESDADKVSTLEAGSTLDMQTSSVDLKKPQDDACALRIMQEDRCNDPNGLRHSGEFTPQGLFVEVDSENRDEEEIIESGNRQHTGRELPEKTEEYNFSRNISSSAVEVVADKNDSQTSQIDKCDASSQIVLDNVNLKDESIIMVCDKTENWTESDNVVINKDNGFDDADNEHLTGSSEGNNGDRYHKLQAVITEFLTDYFNSLRETLLREDGVPCLKDVMVYFNTQCSSVEIRAIVKCVGTGMKITQPLGRLLHMCDHFKARHMKSKLIDFVNMDT